MRAHLLALSLLAACGENATPVTADEVAPPLACLPDRDGVITADELPLPLGETVAYWVSRDQPVDLAGAGPGDATIWDLSEERDGDELVSTGPEALAGRWYAEAMPAGQFVVAGDDGVDSVYHLDALGLWLHGLASHEAEPSGGRTLLVYDAPVLVLRLPLTAGDAWTSTGTVADGELRGLPYVGTDTYEARVVGDGRLDLPYVRFAPALQVRTLVTSEPAAGGVTVRVRQASFYFECFGEIARAVSRLDEPAEQFTTAATLRRFAL